MILQSWRILTILPQKNRIRALDNLHPAVKINFCRFKKWKTPISQEILNRKKENTDITRDLSEKRKRRYHTRSQSIKKMKTPIPHEISIDKKKKKRKRRYHTRSQSKKKKKKTPISREIFFENSFGHHIPATTGLFESKSQ